MDTGVVDKIIDACDNAVKSIIINLEDFNDRDEFIKVQQAAEALDFRVTDSRSFHESNKKKISW